MTMNHCYRKRLLILSFTKRGKILNSTPRPILYVIVISVAILAGIGVTALSATLFVKNYADPAVLSAMIAITGNLTGALIALLVNMRQPSPDTTAVTTPS